MTRVARTLGLVVLVGLGCLAAAPYGTVYVDGVPRSVVAAVVLGAAMALALGRFRLRLWMAAPLAAATLIVYTGAVTSDRVVAGFIPTMGSVVDVGLGATAGWKDLLTVGLPTDADGRLVAGPVALLFVVGWSSVELARRARLGATAMIPPITGLALGLAVAGRSNGPSLLPATLMLVGVLVFLSLRSASTPHSESHAPARGWSLASGPVAAAVAVAAALAGTLAPVTDDGSRFDFRSIVSQPVVPRDDLSPLTRLASQLESDRELFEITVSDMEGLPPEARFLSAAVLDSYDGVLWTTSATFPRVARELVHPSGAGEIEVRAAVTLTDYESSFLPILGDLVGVDDTDLGYSEASGTLVSGEGRPNGFTYEFTARVSDPEAERQLAADGDAAGGDAVGPYLALPDDLPREIVDLAEQVQSGASTTFTRLDLLRDAIAGRSTNAGARSGHSLARIARFLGDEGDAQATSIGTAEQGAAAFALVARQLGLPSRLVVGYRLAEARAGEPITVRASDIHVVAEVLFADVGWVRFDPRLENEVALPEEDSAPIVPDPDDPANVEDQPPPTEPEIGEQPLPAPASVLRDSEHRSPARWWPLGLAGGLVAATLTSPLAKLARRARRRRGHPTTSVLGARSEVRDRLVERGHAVTTSMTLHDLLSSAADRLSPAAAGASEELGALVDRALFDCAAPSSPMAVRAWELERMLRRELSAGVALLARARYHLDPRPLWVGRTPRVRGRR